MGLCYRSVSRVEVYLSPVGSGLGRFRLGIRSWRAYCISDGVGVRGVSHCHGRVAASLLGLTPQLVLLLCVFQVKSLLLGSHIMGGMVPHATARDGNIRVWATMVHTWKEQGLLEEVHVVERRMCKLRLA